MNTLASGTPTVSVVIPCYNYGRFLADCVQSILTQEAVDVSVLIIDDASTDDSAAVAAAIAACDPRVDLLVHNRNKGHIATYNEGLLGWADGDYSVLISADDKLTPGSLRRATAVLEANPGIGFSYGHPLYVRQGEPIPNPWVGSKPPTVWNGDAWIRSVCRLAHSVISTPEVVFRTSLQQEVGPWDPALPHTADLEMWLRFAANADVAYVHADQAFYLRHANNMTLRRSPLIDLEQRRAAFDSLFMAHHDRIPDSARLHRSVRRHLAREALWRACRAYDRRRLAETPVEELIAFARDTSPDATRSSVGFGLKWRQALGPSVVPYLQPLVLSAVVRQVRNRLWWRRWATQGL